MIKQIMIATLLMTGAAAAKCGPSLDITLDSDEREYARSHGNVGSDLLNFDEDRALGFGDTAEIRTFNTNRPVTRYGNTQDDTENFGVKLTFKIPLGEDYCTEQESAKLFRDKEYAKRASLDNIEKQLRLCKQYGEDHPLLEGQCK